MEKVKLTLLKRYYEVAGKLYGDFFMRIKGSDDTKKILETNDFMMGLMNGELKKEWKIENTEEYKELVSLVKVINNL